MNAGAPDRQAIAALRDELAARRQAATDAYRRQARADVLLARLRGHCDAALLQLVNIVSLPQGAALAAIGGYGRGELYPCSDVDVMILLARPPDENDVACIQRLVAAMWDLGLKPSHSVRSLDDCLELAAEDVTVQTALLEARWLAGSRRLMGQLSDRLDGVMDPRRFFLDKRHEMRRRHAHFHNTPYALEPNCKESPGALRDLHLLQWLAKAAGYGASWRQIMQAGALTHAEYASLRRAQAAFRRLRVELHLLTGRREDRLLFDLQPALARIYGFESSRNRKASELLMQRYYWAARVVSLLTMVLMQAIEERLFTPPGLPEALDADFCIRNGRLDLRRPDALARNPSLIFRAFLHLQKHEALSGMRAQLLRALWHARTRIDGQFRRNPVNRRLFMRILEQERRVSETFRDMNQLGILPRYLPAFRRILGLMQHDLFHAYTVDEHTLRLISLLCRYAQPEHAHEYPLASQLMEGFGRRALLIVAALFHDIAKGQPREHSEQGAKLAAGFCRQHRLGTADTALVVFLVKEHLSMSRVAQKQDMSDPGVIHDFAATVQTPRSLAALYLLTVADIQATNPRIWNAWKNRLLDNLYQRTLIALGGKRPDTQTVMAQRKAQAIAQSRRQGVSDASREALWRELDVAYFLRHEAGELAWHCAQLAGHLNTGAAIVRARVIGNNDALQVLVYLRDRKDLFVRICQYFEQHTLSIQDARIHTTHHGWALDSFIVLLAQQCVDYHAMTASLEHALAAHLENTPDTQRPNGMHWPKAGKRQAASFPLAPTVELHPQANGSGWRLSIVATDRPGLLHDLASVFSAHEIALKMAKIHTLGQRAEDVFIIEGDPLDHPPARLRLEHALLGVLAALC